MSALPTKKLLQNAFAYNSENLPGGFNDSLEVFIEVREKIGLFKVRLNVRAGGGQPPRQ